MLALFWLDVQNLRTCAAPSFAHTGTPTAQDTTQHSPHHQKCGDVLVDNNPANISATTPDEGVTRLNINNEVTTINNCTCDNNVNSSERVQSDCPDEESCDNTKSSVLNSNRQQSCEKCSSNYNNDKYNNNNNGNIDNTINSSIIDDFGDFQSSYEENFTVGDEPNLNTNKNNNNNNGDSERTAPPEAPPARIAGDLTLPVCPLRQQLVKEVWRIYERYVAADSDLCCPVSEASKRVATERVNALHLQFDPDCFAEAQQEAFDTLERWVDEALLTEVKRLIISTF